MQNILRQNIMVANFNIFNLYNVYNQCEFVFNKIYSYIDEDYKENSISNFANEKYSSQQASFLSKIDANKRDSYIDNPNEIDKIINLGKSQKVVAVSFDIRRSTILLQNCII